MSLINVNTATFDGVDLATISGLTILSTNPYKLPKRTLSSYVLARANKTKNNSAFYTDRNIEVRVGITRATRDLLETSIDSLNRILQGLEKPLILKQSNGLRKYYCTFSSAQAKEDGGSYIELSLMFDCSDSFGYDTADTLLTAWSAVTGNYRTDTLDVGGSADWQAPVITRTYSSITSDGTDKDVVIGNGATGAAITISRIWATNDVLEVDCYNRTVKVNGVEVLFSGGFPEFAPGVGYLTYSDQFTARTYSGQAVYAKRWV